jgi:hypothetical protein
MNKKIIFSFILAGMVSISLFAQERHPYTRQATPTCDSYRFVIIGDLTGGEEPGVFSNAIDRINELAPDFVITVGDLIEGYTQDKTIIREQWKQFHQSLDKLEAPFYYVPGNHDVANPVLQAVWDSLYNDSYYTFHIQKDLFVVLNMFEPGKNGLYPEQTEKILHDVKAYSKGGRIFLFSHSPLWEDNDDFLAELAPYEVYYFSGHEHHYVHRTYKGQQHYMLAGLATGGRNLPELGLFHNLMYVTSSPKQVNIANIQLEGLLSPSIVDETSEKQVNLFLSRRWANIRPTVISDNSGIISSVLTVNNNSDYPLAISATPVETEGVSISGIDAFTVPAQTVQRVDVQMKLAKGTNIDNLPAIGLRLNGAIQQPGKQLSAEIVAEWVIDHPRACNNQTDRDILCVHPAEVEESWDWSGIADGTFEYKVYSDRQFVYIDVKTQDDVLIKPESNSSVTDKISIYFSPDTTFKTRSYAVFDYIPDSKVKVNEKSTWKVSGFQGNCEIESNSIHASLKIPRKMIKNNCFRLNIAFTDADNSINLDPAVIWWKPRWNTRKDYPGAGCFVINQD